MFICRWHENFAASYDFDELANNINSDLENVAIWLNIDKLKSHPSKTKFIIIGCKQILTNKSGDLDSWILHFYES